MAFVEPTTNPWFRPGRNINPPGGEAPENAGRLGMTGRSDGAAGIFIAYLRGRNVFNSSPTVWRIGDFRPIQLNGHDGRYVDVAMSVDGRLWAFWAEGLTTGENRRIFARRSNENATKFGETVAVSHPKAPMPATSGPSREGPRPVARSTSSAHPKGRFG